MILRPHPGLRLHRYEIGAEKAPLLVIDNVVADPDRLVYKAGRSEFSPQGEYFPGVRARAPAAYDRFLAELLAPLLREHFGMQPARFAFPMCHYSLVTTPAEGLAFLQRVPHIDSVEANGLATVHYLFHGEWGGTAFYRHRATGFEVVDVSRRDTYFARLAEESRGADAPKPGYIGDDTPLFEHIGQVEPAFNRMAVYRRNSLHSGRIDDACVPPADPLAGRLSINSFIDVLA